MKKLKFLSTFILIGLCVLFVGCNLHTCNFNEWGHCTVCSNSICIKLTESESMIYTCDTENFKTNTHHYYKFVANGESGIQFLLETNDNVVFDRIELFPEDNYVMAKKVAGKYSNTDYRIADANLESGKTYHLMISYFGEGSGKLKVVGNI